MLKHIPGAVAIFTFVSRPLRESHRLNGGDSNERWLQAGAAWVGPSTHQPPLKGLSGLPAGQSGLVGEVGDEVRGEEFVSSFMAGKFEGISRGLSLVGVGLLDCAVLRQ